MKLIQDEKLTLPEVSAKSSAHIPKWNTLKPEQ